MTETKHMTRQERRNDALRWAGARLASYNRVTGSLIVMLDSRRGGEWAADPDSGRFTIMCDDHSTLVQGEDFRVMRSHMAYPEWCPDCQELMAAGRKVPGAPAPRGARKDSEPLEDDDYFLALRDQVRGE